MPGKNDKNKTEHSTEDKRKLDIEDVDAEGEEVRGGGISYTLDSHPMPLSDAELDDGWGMV